MERFGLVNTPEEKEQHHKQLLNAYADKLKIVQERKRMLHEVAEEARQKLSHLRDQRKDAELKREELLGKMHDLPPVDIAYQTSMNAYLDTEYPGMLEEIDYLIGLQESHLERFEQEIASVQTVEADIEQALKDHQDAVHPA